MNGINAFTRRDHRANSLPFCHVTLQGELDCPQLGKGLSPSHAGTLISGLQPPRYDKSIFLVHVTQSMVIC